MGFPISAIVKAKKNLIRSRSLKGSDVPKGYFAVYVGESEKKRFVIPISLLKEPSFQDLLSQTEEEYGYEHAMGGITIACSEDIFFNLISQSNPVLKGNRDNSLPQLANCSGASRRFSKMASTKSNFDLKSRNHA
ncbi:hypothetical protein FNV43_RR22925 [Rhamnella rubrinervis]|uniref:Small auxin up regulated protein n=1 Tax=Rhamnella rubrinervis TaxID=2594499 RepID=A0A8K0DV77_9ROSA|nr:hypothetical protein FNV43_RR22925 [Rhamnella rubrinervis]